MIKVTSQVAHDIRGPLTSLNAAVKYWKKNPPPESDYLMMLEMSAQRFNNIANEVLERPDEKKKSVFSLHKVLDELAGEYSSSNTDIRFQKVYEEALSVAGNRDRLQRTFGNIMKNGIEAMNGKGTITLKTFAQSDCAVIEICDQGSGISPDKLVRVLQGGYTEGKRDGHGIGMQVVNDTIREHQGRLEAESTLGSGTTFRIKLPLPDSAVLKTSNQIEEGAGIFELKATKGEQIVVIDDDPSVQLQWELTLRKEGLEPLLYESFEDYEKRSAERPVLKSAIVDYHYDTSELNGFQIIEKLRAQGYSNIILCTGEYWKPMIQKQAKELGIPICPKPIPEVVVKST